MVFVVLVVEETIKKNSLFEGAVSVVSQNRPDPPYLSSELHTI